MSSSFEGAEPSVADVLGRAAAELEAQAGAVDALHVLAEDPSPGGEAGPRGEALRAAQSIDVVAQHLRALAGVLAALGRASPAGAGVPAGVLDAVALSDLSARLRGAAPAAAPEEGGFELL